MTRKFLLTTCALLASVGTAMAETQPLTESLLKESEKTAAEKAVTKNDAGRVVRSGKSHTLYFATSINPDCSLFGETDVVVTRKPDHGTVETMPSEGFPYYKEPNLRAHCNSKKVRGLSVNYKSSSGYVGVDEFEITVFYSNGFAQEIHFALSVR